jgi:hypothetical protein
MEIARKALIVPVLCLMALGPHAFAGVDRRGEIYNLGLDLERTASEMAVESYEHFKGRDGEISDREQAILFKSEAFLASCRLFLKLAEERSDYFRSGYLRTNLYNAFTYLVRSFHDLEEEMKRGGIQPYSLSDLRKILKAMDSEFSGWPSADNLSYLHQKYVKGRDASVYMIERVGVGAYVRRAFKSLESLYRYNYDLKRGKDPWAFLVEVPEDSLARMDEGAPIVLGFEGRLVIEQGDRSNRSVYLIEKGKKRGIANPRVLDRFGGWGNVFEVPAEIIAGYPEGEPVK